MGGGPGCVNTVNSVVPDIFADMLHGQILLVSDALHADQDIQLDHVGLNFAFTMAVSAEFALLVLTDLLMLQELRQVGIQRPLQVQQVPVSLPATEPAVGPG